MLDGRGPPGCDAATTKSSAKSRRTTSFCGRDFDPVILFVFGSFVVASLIAIRAPVQDDEFKFIVKTRPRTNSPLKAENIFLRLNVRARVSLSRDANALR